MKISVGSDERNPVTDAVVDELQRRGHELTPRVPMKDVVGHWPRVARAVAVAKEILDTWFSTSYKPNTEDDTRLRELAEIEADHHI